MPHACSSSSLHSTSLVATLHDVQAYAHAIRDELGLHELSSRHLGGERMAWVPLLEWLESREMEISAQTALGPRNLLLQPTSQALDPRA